MPLSEVQFILIDDDPNERVLFLSDIANAKILNQCRVFSSVRETLDTLNLSAEIPAMARCVVFLDFNIPSENSTENVKKLRAAFPRSAIAVISAHPPLDKIQNLPINAVFAKPPKLKDVITLMEAHPWMMVTFFAGNGD